MASALYTEGSSGGKGPTRKDKRETPLGMQWDLSPRPTVSATAEDSAHRALPEGCKAVPLQPGPPLEKVVFLERPQERGHAGWYV